MYNFIMKIPSITKFLDIKDPRDQMGSPKVEDIDRENLPPKEVFLTWDYTVSAENKKWVSKRFYRPFLIIGIFVGLLLLIMQEFFVILIIGSIIFFIQAVMKMSPENVKYEINNHGILIGDDLYYWDKLRRYFFISRDGNEVLSVDTTLGFPGRIYMYFNSVDKEKIRGVLDKYLHFLENEPRTFLDNAYDKVTTKFSVDDDDDEISQEDTPIEKPKESKKESTDK